MANPSSPDLTALGDESADLIKRLDKGIADLDKVKAILEKQTIDIEEARTLCLHEQTEHAKEKAALEKQKTVSIDEMKERLDRFRVQAKEQDRKRSCEIQNLEAEKEDMERELKKAKTDLASMTEKLSHANDALRTMNATNGGGDSSISKAGLNLQDTKPKKASEHVDIAGMREQIVANSKVLYLLKCKANNVHRVKVPGKDFNIITVGKEVIIRAMVIFHNRDESGWMPLGHEVFLQGVPADSTGSALEKLLNLTNELLDEKPQFQ